MISDEDKIKTVHTFHDQVMSAVLDNKELTFFELLENFFQKIARKNYTKGYEAGWNDGIMAAAAMNVKVED